MAKGERRRKSLERVAITVAQADDRLDPVVAELAPERSDVDVHGPRLHVRIVVPEPGEDRVARHDAAPAAQQEPQQVELLLRQVHALAVQPDFEARAVDDQRAVVKDLFVGAVERGGPAQLCVDPREQLPHGERLGDVVIRSDLEPEQLISLFDARRQHDDRHPARLVGALQLPAEGEAVDVRQIQVQDHEIERLLLERRQGR